MAKGDQEVEVKFYLRSLPKLVDRLETLGAKLACERVYELNLRFDREDGSLMRARQVLRLRKDANAVLTFKGPARSDLPSARQEIEFQVSDFAAAQRFLEALGYVVVVTYEKFRTTYELGDVIVTLDELPYGSFAEIEAAGTASEEAENAVSSLRTAAAILRLNWEAHITASYLALFDRLKNARSLPAQNLMFSELQGVSIKPEDLGVRYAD